MTSKKGITPAVAIKPGQRGRFTNISDAVSVANAHANLRGMNNPAGYVVVRCTRAYEVAYPDTKFHVTAKVELRWKREFGWVQIKDDIVPSEEESL